MSEKIAHTYHYALLCNCKQSLCYSFAIIDNFMTLHKSAGECIILFIKKKIRDKKEYKI